MSGSVRRGCLLAVAGGRRKRHREDRGQVLRRKPAVAAREPACLEAEGGFGSPACPRRRSRISLLTAGASRASVEMGSVADAGWTTCRVSLFPEGRRGTSTSPPRSAAPAPTAATTATVAADLATADVATALPTPAPTDPARPAPEPPDPAPRMPCSSPAAATAGNGVSAASSCRRSPMSSRNFRQLGQARRCARMSRRRTIRPSALERACITCSQFISRPSSISRRLSRAS